MIPYEMLIPLTLVLVTIACAVILAVGFLLLGLVRELRREARAVRSDPWRRG